MNHNFSKDKPICCLSLRFIRGCWSNSNTNKVLTLTSKSYLFANSSSSFDEAFFHKWIKKTNNNKKRASKKSSFKRDLLAN